MSRNYLFRNKILRSDNHANIALKTFIYSKNFSFLLSAFICLIIQSSYFCSVPIIKDAFYCFGLFPLHVHPSPLASTLYLKIENSFYEICNYGSVASLFAKSLWKVPKLKNILTIRNCCAPNTIYLTPFPTCFHKGFICRARILISSKSVKIHSGIFPGTVVPE